MKLWNSRRAGQMGQLTKYMMIGTAAAAFMGLSMNAQAQPACTIGNWPGTEVGVVEGDAALPSDGHRRYAGPCSLGVSVDGVDRYVVDNSPSAENAYIARFYVYLGDAGSADTMIYAAQDAGANVIQVHYNDPSPGDLTMYVFDDGAGQASATFQAADINTNWVSVEFSWSADDQPKLFSVNGMADEALALDTSGVGITDALLGNINGADSGTGSVLYFDDFDSRRSTRPGRLCRGLTDAGRESLTIGDAQAIFSEVASAGSNLASGQPDFDENGSITIADAQGVFARVAAATNSCDLNS